MSQKNRKESPKHKSEDILETVVSILRKQAKNGRPGAFIENPARIEEMETVYKSIVDSVAGDDTTISYEISDLFCTSGSINITGKEVLFKDPKVLVEASRCADSMEIYARTDGYAVMDFVFYRITKEL